MSTLTLDTTNGRSTTQASDAKARVAKRRVQFDLTPRSMDRLNALKLKTEASSYAEVVKNALRLYEALIEEAEGGKEFLVKDQAGTVTPLRLFL